MVAAKYDIILDKKVDELRESVALLIKMVARLQDDLKKIDERTMRSRSEVRQAIVALTNISHREDNDQRLERYAEAIRKDTRRQTPSPYLPDKNT